MDVDNKYGALDIQKNLIKLLEAFHEFCVSNSIKYSLDWGSLLGAVRHKGFIPWDDDLDIMVDRVNYHLILEKISSPLCVQTDSNLGMWIDRIRFNNNNDMSSFAPTIDIFVVDNAPNSNLYRRIRVASLLFLQGMMKKKPNFKKGNLFYRFATLVSYLFGKMMTAKQKICLYQWISQLSNNKQTEKKACYNSDFGDIVKLYSNNILDDVEEVPFEGITVYITTRYHQCLIDKFGLDYMTPPMELDRIPRHLILDCNTKYE